jgi:phospholipase C
MNKNIAGPWIVVLAACVGFVGACRADTAPTTFPRDNLVNNAYRYGFATYGVRVPAVIVSPWIAPGTKIRPPQRDRGPPFDHTSIIRTTRELFALDRCLTARDGAAPSLVPALTLSAPNNDGPRSVTADLDTPKPALLSARGAAPPNDMQRALAVAASLLPDSLPATEACAPGPRPLPDSSRYPTTALARNAAATRVKDLLHLS